MNDSTKNETTEHVETVGAFDIRIFIATLICLFGVILVALGIFAFNAHEAAITGGINGNLWTGIIMIVVAILFVVWAKIDPIRMVVRENEPGAEEPRDIAPVD
ncbi:tetraspanin family protein [Devriesea agamarum]|uniref:tetraspanin family protein n=1 Tax=Devriesea agamarum TaxID=472569 RepID=UPI00071DD07F|nr:tetraspanin family protein [Devriesea agamarum]